jgi:hypothetical protein
MDSKLLLRIYIYNADETGLSMVKKSGTILLQKDAKP